jgi:predicted Fe-Mo cluster-binding NifX family protein
MASYSIAIGSADGISVCGHLARSASFLILEIDDGQVISREVRVRGDDQCGRHKTFVDLMQGCRAVLCGGAGQGAVDALAKAGVQVVVLARPMRVEDAVRGYLDGSLETTGARVCLCG